MSSDVLKAIWSRVDPVSCSCNVFEAAPAGLILLDADGLILRVNPFTEALLGYTPTGFMQRPLTQYICPEDQDDFRQSWRNLVTSEGIQDVLLQMMKQDQSLIQVQLRLKTVRKASRKSRALYLASIVDSELNGIPLKLKSELIFQSALLDSIGEAVIATDLDGTILYWNKAAEQIYGWEAREVLGNNIIATTPADENKDLGLEIMKALQAGQTWSGEFIVRHRDGHQFPARVTDTCLRDHSGNLSVIIGVSSDLTEKKAMEAQWKHLQGELHAQQIAMVNAEKVHAEEASRFKSEFIANMSHEIRTPLAVIRGYAEILAGDDRQVNRRECIDSILRASRQVELLVNDILDIAKVESGKLELELMPVSISTIFADIKEMLNIKVAEKNVRLGFTIDCNVPHFIHTDPFRLKQILLNVIGNAIKFSPNGQVSVKAALMANGDGPSPPLLSLVVSDTGIGMTQAQSAKIFGAFSQADRSITRNYGGTGLGLSLSLELARLLGGDLVLQNSEPGRGSTFVLTINPGDSCNEVKPPEPALPHPSAVMTVKSNFQENNIRDMKILIAEDAEDVRAIIKYFLQNQCASVTEAANGEEAIHLAHAAVFDAIIMDLQMPICDGFNATRRLRAEGCSWPIFALTAHAMTGERERCLAAGFSGYLTKPINFKQLSEVLSSERRLH